MNSKNLRGWFLILIIGVAFFFFTTNDYIPSHSIYNDGERGTSKLRDSIESNTNLSLSRLLISPFIITGEQDFDIMIIVGSERSYTDAEVNAYREYVDDGGTLLIFEDFGPARDIANSMGISFFSGTVRETTNELMVNRPSQFFARDLVSQFVAGGQYELFVLVSEAAAILDLQGFLNGNAFPILATFPSAFVDQDNDNQIDSGDISNNNGLPLGIFKQYGDGNLVVISDSSIPLNRYWGKKVELEGQLYNVPNPLWTILLISFLSEYVGASNIVFDESHQEIIPTSAPGLFNLVVGVWVSVLNSGGALIFIFSGIILSGMLLNRKSVRKTLASIRGQDLEKDENTPAYISNPTLAERSISEQFILYHVMEDEFLHIANSELKGLLEETGKADNFLRQLHQKYGDLDKKRSKRQLLEIHNKMRNFVENELRKRL